jgi:predicted nucleic acid-binding protein
VSEPPSAASRLLDTSVVIDLDQMPPDFFADRMAVSALTLAELSAGTHATADYSERARRVQFLQRVEATFTPLPFGAEAARAYGAIWASVSAAGRKPRGAGAFDLLIAATAMAADLPLWTRNRADFVGLEGLVEIVAV